MQRRVRQLRKISKALEPASSKCQSSQFLGKEREWGTYIPIPCVEYLSVRLPKLINSAGQVHFCGDGGKSRVGTKRIERWIMLEVNELRIALLKRKLEVMNRLLVAS